ncbi:MAG: prepilin-type N-terminal cleavage/methylation domain-containing protein [Synechococcaceae cyanobacterium SM2_3_1]|nr:prepilin-type N-terminal cleavage/methylation domain-containing protein [Synechococcaceae cyanobacterium SM2_3_1]
MQFQRKPLSLREKGFNLIEVIVSLLIVSIALAALAPALALAAYRRVLAERIEVGTQLAQGEIDRIRSLVDECNQDGCPFLADDALSPATADFSQPFANVSAPTGLPSNVGLPQVIGSSTVSLLEVEGSGLATGQPEEYVIQTFRDNGAPCVDDRNNILYDGNGDILPCSFQMGVRVYHRRSFDATGLPFPDMDLYRDPVTASATFARQGSRLRPVAVVEASISQASTLGDLCRALATNAATQCDSFPTPIP